VNILIKNIQLFRYNVNVTYLKIDKNDSTSRNVTSSHRVRKLKFKFKKRNKLSTMHLRMTPFAVSGVYFEIIEL